MSPEASSESGSEGDVLKLLANDTNRRVLAIVRAAPAHPRRVAEALGIGETEASRRLRAMERAGLVAGAWARVHDANVREYSLNTARVVLAFENTGLRITLEAPKGERTSVVSGYVFDLPEVTTFIGDPTALARDLVEQRVVYLSGLPGTGKTLLAAEAARKSGLRTFWHAARESDVLLAFLHRLAAFLARVGEPALLNAINEGAPTEKLVAEAKRAVDRPDVLVAVDDAQRVGDAALLEFLHALVAGLTQGHLLLVSRGAPRFLAPNQKIVVRTRDGFTLDDTRAFFAEKGVRLEADALAKVHAKFGGHPLVLNFYAEALAQGKLNLAEVLDEIPEAEVESYLSHQCFAELPEREQRALEAASFLLSPFPREAVAAAIDDPRALPALAALERRLLVSRAGDRCSVHEVVANFARALVVKPEAIHRRAAKFYEERGTVDGRLEAMHHLLAAKDKAAVAHMLEHDLDLPEMDALARGHLSLYRDVLAEFSEKDVPPRVWTNVLDDRGDLAFHDGDFAAAERLYGEAMKRAEAAKDDSRVADVAWKLALLFEKTDAARAKAAVKRGLAAEGADERTRRRLVEVAKRFGLKTD
ncbi:MAG: ArsR/SmtB family transcription factor [Thermoplasmatota archaeon]